MLYHGSPVYFNHFRTPTGCEVMDVTSGGVIYLTEDIKVARKYAGRRGYVYEVSAPSAIPYGLQREKQGLPPKNRRYIKGVWVALPSACDIISVTPV